MEKITITLTQAVIDLYPDLAQFGVNTQVDVVLAGTTDGNEHPVDPPGHS